MVITLQSLGTDAIREPKGTGSVALNNNSWSYGLRVVSGTFRPFFSWASVPLIKGTAAYSLPEINTHLFGPRNVVTGPD